MLNIRELFLNASFTTKIVIFLSKINILFENNLLQKMIYKFLKFWNFLTYFLSGNYHSIKYTEIKILQ